MPHHAKLHFKSRFYVKDFSLLLQEDEPRRDRKLSPLSGHHLRQDFLHSAEVEGIRHVVDVFLVQFCYVFLFLDVKLMLRQACRSFRFGFSLCILLFFIMIGV